MALNGQCSMKTATNLVQPVESPQNIMNRQNGISPAGGEMNGKERRAEEGSKSPGTSKSSCKSTCKEKEINILLNNIIFIWEVKPSHFVF